MHRGHRQPDRQGTRVVERSGAHWGTGAVATVQSEDTDNQSDRGTEWGTVNGTMSGHRQPVRRGTRGQSTIRTEGTDNQSDRGYTQWGTLSTVSYAYSGPKQTVK